MKRTIESLRDILRGSVYVYLKDEATCRKFYEDAEAEGYRFGNILPTDSPTDDVIVVHGDKTLGHAGFAGHMKFHHPEASSEEFHRIDYAKYVSGAEDFYYREERHRAERKAERKRKNPDYIEAHKWSFQNEESIKKSSTCGCFYCLSIFPAKQVTDWTDDMLGTLTALCPKCGIDSCVGDASGYPVTGELLQEMQKYWF